MTEEAEVQVQTEGVTEKKVREIRRSSIPTDVVEGLVADLPRYSKASFDVIGHRNGVRIAVPKTNGVSRVYFYGCDDYSLVPVHPAIRQFSVEDRKENNRGGIMAEIDFSGGSDVALEALRVLIDVVRAAPAPAPKGVKAPKAPRKAKTVEVVPDPTGSTETVAPEA